MVDYISAIGPQSSLLPQGEISGHRPVNRHGEVTQNAVVDNDLWNGIVKPADGKYPPSIVVNGALSESIPQWHEWASTTPGDICVTARDRHRRYATRMASETAVPVLVSAQLLDETQDKFYAFAGITRSKSIRDYDEQVNGPKVDEFFTLAIGGMFSILNNGNGTIQVGDAVEWTFMDREDSFVPDWKATTKKQKAGPRKIQVRKATNSHARVFGIAKTYAKRGEQFDVLIGSASM